ncbi:MAG: hypothetical protein D6722_07795 [Bacteroidetes bacterium]|nr:MAG: hypothetical protein D6722_07795 [Bacteroidota bacterium]
MRTIVPFLLALLMAAGSSLSAQTICIRNTPRQGNTHWQQMTTNWSRSCPDRGNRNRGDRNRLHIQLGGAAHYSHGLLSESAANATYSPEFTGWQGTGFAGIRLEPGRRKRSNVIGAWGTMGFLPDAALSNLLLLQGLPDDVDPGSSGHEFREWEVGILFKEWFRISAGRGWQRYTDLSLDEQELAYYTATAGVSLNITRSIKWNTTATLLFGDDFAEYAFRPATGLAFRFNAF